MKSAVCFEAVNSAIIIIIIKLYTVSEEYSTKNCNIIQKEKNKQKSGSFFIVNTICRRERRSQIFVMAVKIKIIHIRISKIHKMSCIWNIQNTYRTSSKAYILRRLKRCEILLHWKPGQETDTVRMAMREAGRWNSSKWRGTRRCCKIWSDHILNNSTGWSSRAVSSLFPFNVTVLHFAACFQTEWLRYLELDGEIKTWRLIVFPDHVARIKIWLDGVKNYVIV